MFSNCIYLTFLPDISKWNTSKVIDMNYMFSECSTLKSLPDISKWDIGNVEYMDNMFNKCSSLSSIPNFYKKEIILKYIVENENSTLTIFGEDFVKKNRNKKKLKLLKDNKQIQLEEKLIECKKGILELKLSGINNIFLGSN